jgi:hypothetical protein
MRKASLIYQIPKVLNIRSIKSLRVFHFNGKRSDETKNCKRWDKG